MNKNKSDVQDACSQKEQGLNVLEGRRVRVVCSGDDMCNCTGECLEGNTKTDD